MKSELNHCEKWIELVNKHVTKNDEKQKYYVYKTGSTKYKWFETIESVYNYIFHKNSKHASFRIVLK